MMTSVAKTLEQLSDLIKIKAAIFALPFVITAMVWAADGLPEARAILWILIAAFSGRAAAMAFNEFADREYDAKNPRTRNRLLPTGVVSPAQVVAFVIGMSALFIFSAAMLNRLTLLLSPVALFILLGYSFINKITYSHPFVGLGQSVGPVGAWIGIRGELDLPAVLLGLGVLLWGTGFDAYYDIQDLEFDQEHGYSSIPVRFGIPATLRFARFIHALMVAALVPLYFLLDLNFLYLIGLTLIAALLVYEHWIIDPRDFTTIRRAFQRVNGAISLVFMTFSIAAIF
ncbi:MAG: UbiA-like polyprenyltransferase [Candidatus Bipolaricaulia bacterium]